MKIDPKSFYTSVEKHKDQLLVSGYGSAEQKFYHTERYQPTLYVDTNDIDDHNYELLGEPAHKLKPFEFDSMSQVYPVINGAREFYGNTKWPITYIYDQFKGSKDIYNPDLIGVATIDIETKADEGFPDPVEAKQPVLSIALTYSKHKDIIYILGYGDYDKTKSRYKDDVHINYIKCENEHELFREFIELWAYDLNHPDIITGWNTRYYDIPYLINRAKNIGFERIELLSPWKIIKEKKSIKYNAPYMQNTNRNSYHIYGVADLDYKLMFEKFAYDYNPLESYRLNDVSQIVLGQEKLSFDDAGNLYTLLITSDNVKYDKEKDIEELPVFQQWCRIRDELMAEIEHRSIDMSAVKAAEASDYADTEEARLNPEDTLRTAIYLYKTPMFPERSVMTDGALICLYHIANEMANQECYQIGIDYNILDVLLIDRMDQKLKLMELGMYIAYKAGITFDHIFGTITLWDSIVYNHLQDQGIIIPMQERKSDSKPMELEGGYVKQPISGKHRDVVSFDFTSLYPHIIMQWNMSVDTVVPETFSGMTEDRMLGISEMNLHKKPNYVVAADGQYFDKESQGVFPELMREMYEERKKTKSELFHVKQQIQESGENTELENKVSALNNKQLALKIMLNSAYGAISNQYFRYFDARIARSITACGRLAIKSLEKCINSYLNDLLRTDGQDYVVAGDTDSCYVSLEKFIERIDPNRKLTNEKKVEILDQFCNGPMKVVINEEFNRLAKMVNANENKLYAKRELIIDSGIWTRKKRYVLNVLNDEGITHDPPVTKVKGFESVRSSSPQLCRDKLLESYKILLDSDDPSEIWKFINQFRTEFNNERVENIASPRSVNDLDKYSDPNTIFTKGTPIGVRAALLYNFFVKSFGLTGKYRLIENGEKIKYIHLTTPNLIMHQNVIAFPDDVFPYDMDIEKYIDYETQFEKTFLGAMNNVLEFTESAESSQTLERFFT